MSTTTTPPVRFRTWTSALPVSCERGHVAYVYSYDPRAQLEAMKREQDLDTLNFSPDGETGWEVWGTRQGKQFKLRLLLDLPAHVLELDEEDRTLWIAWQDCGGEEDQTIDEAKEALVGIYRNEKEAGEEIGRQYFEDSGSTLPDWLVIDWEATWECNLRHDFSSTSHDGQLYVFRQ